MLEEFYSRHDKVGVLFSGGKESLALLYLLKPYWHKTVFVWVDTESNLPEIVALMDKVKAMVPHFMRVASCQRHFVKCHGHPSDVVPLSLSEVGQFYTGARKISVCSRYECCKHNIWDAVEAAVSVSNITGWVKGQRNEDKEVAPFERYFKAGGKDCEMVYPLREWTYAQVLQFLERNGVEIDERLRLPHSTSLDCWGCTAYWDGHADRDAYMRKHHNEKWKEVRKIENAIVSECFAELRKIVGDQNGLG